MLTDPVYEGKSMAGLIGMVRSGEIPRRLTRALRPPRRPAGAVRVRPYAGIGRLTGRGAQNGLMTTDPSPPAMDPSDFPAPSEGFVLTFFLLVEDQDRSRDFYTSMFGGKVIFERDPVILKVANSWLILNTGGGPTDDKPDVVLATPSDLNTTSAFMNVRVADIWALYREWSAKGIPFLTEPKDHGREIRAYVRDPDGHLIEIGQFVPA